MPEKTDHDRIVEIHTVLLGADGDDGLVGEVKRQGKELYSLKRCFWTSPSIVAAGSKIASRQPAGGSGGSPANVRTAADAVGARSPAHTLSTGCGSVRHDRWSRMKISTWLPHSWVR